MSKDDDKVLVLRHVVGKGRGHLAVVDTLPDDLFDRPQATKAKVEPQPPPPEMPAPLHPAPVLNRKRTGVTMIGDYEPEFAKGSLSIASHTPHEAIRWEGRLIGLVTVKHQGRKGLEELVRHGCHFVNACVFETILENPDHVDGELFHAVESDVDPVDVAWYFGGTIYTDARGHLWVRGLRFDGAGNMTEVLKDLRNSWSRYERLVVHQDAVPRQPYIFSKQTKSVLGALFFLALTGALTLQYWPYIYNTALETFG